MEEKLANILLAQFGVGGLIFVVIILAFWRIYSEQRKIRTELGAKLDHDLVSQRVAAYQSLWSMMRPLAIYSGEKFDSKLAGELYEELSGWYFSETGGLFLTKTSREFYFTLQKYLKTITNLDGWECANRPENPKKVFTDFLMKLSDDSSDIKHVIAHLKQPEIINLKKWRSSYNIIIKEINLLVGKLDVHAGDIIFASAQQFSSILRTNLTHEVRSRIDVDWGEY